MKIKLIYKDGSFRESENVEDYIFDKEINALKYIIQNRNDSIKIPFDVCKYIYINEIKVYES